MWFHLKSSLSPISWGALEHELSCHEVRGKAFMPPLNRSVATCHVFIDKGGGPNLLGITGQGNSMGRDHFLEKHEAVGS